jgi:hypothetical protein
VSGAQLWTAHLQRSYAQATPVPLVTKRESFFFLLGETSWVYFHQVSYEIFLSALLLGEGISLKFGLSCGKR